jgi:hypothetical protein
MPRKITENRSNPLGKAVNASRRSFQHLRIIDLARSVVNENFSGFAEFRARVITRSMHEGGRGEPMRARRKEVAMPQFNGPFSLSSNGYLMEIRGPAWYKNKASCQKKLCFVATDLGLLADVLGQLAERPDCHYVKYSTYQKDGMYLGRCFLTDEHAVGVLWAKYKEHPSLFCTVQDDDFTAPFRSS